MTGVEEAIRLSLDGDGVLTLDGRRLGLVEAKQIHEKLGVLIRAAEVIQGKPVRLRRSAGPRARARREAVDIPEEGAGGEVARVA